MKTGPGDGRRACCFRRRETIMRDIPRGSLEDNSRNGSPITWAQKHNEVMVKIHAILEHDLWDALNQREIRIQNRTDESHVQYIPTVHDRLAALAAEIGQRS
jgi:hypothetical protein